MSQYEEKSDDVNVECPYCGCQYQIEGEDMTEDERIDVCDECGKKYYRYSSFSVTHSSSPDCVLNGEEHQWTMTYDDRREECSVCGKMREKSW